MATIEQIKTGNPVTWNYEIQNEEVAVDITGFTVRLIIKENATDTDNAALFNKAQVTHSDPENGKGSILMTSAECLSMPVGRPPHYAFRIYDASGDLYKEYPTLRNVQFVSHLYSD